MKIKKIILGLSGMGLLVTAAPIFSTSTNQITFVHSRNAQSLDIGNKLIEVESINKSCENLVTCDFPGKSKYYTKFTQYCSISNIDSRVKIEDGNETNDGVKVGKIERDDLFTYSRKDTQYTSYHRYKSNHVEKNNHTSWGNAKKYQLNVTVPTNTKEYKVQVVANVKIKNCHEASPKRSKGLAYSFAQAKLSQLSTSTEDTLMPFIGIKNENMYEYNGEYFKIASNNDLFALFESGKLYECKPYETAKLSSTISLSNETPEPKEIPVYFWYGFFGGGFTGKGYGSHINCSEVWFSANHIE